MVIGQYGPNGDRAIKVAAWAFHPGFVGVQTLSHLQAGIIARVIPKNLLNAMISLAQVFYTVSLVFIIFF